jgi:hypothetical protein
LDQAYRDYFGATADFNRAQFRLYRALGHPAEALSQPAAPAGQPVPTTPPVPPPGPNPN